MKIVTKAKSNPKRPAAPKIPAYPDRFSDDGPLRIVKPTRGPKPKSNPKPRIRYYPDRFHADGPVKIEFPEKKPK